MKREVLWSELPKKWSQGQCFQFILEYYIKSLKKKQGNYPRVIRKKETPLILDLTAGTERKCWKEYRLNEISQGQSQFKNSVQVQFNDIREEVEADFHFDIRWPWAYSGKIIPSNSYDVIFWDPPYGVDARYYERREYIEWFGFKQVYEYDEMVVKTSGLKQQIYMLNLEAHRILKPGGILIAKLMDVHSDGKLFETPDFLWMWLTRNEVNLNANFDKWDQMYWNYQSTGRFVYTSRSKKKTVLWIVYKRKQDFIPKKVKWQRLDEQEKSKVIPKSERLRLEDEKKQEKLVWD